MIPTTTKNNMLDGQTINSASLHTSFPGSTGANEVTGGSYARKAITMAAASGGQRLLSAGVTFDIPAVTTVKWIGYWNTSTFVATAPNGGATPKNFVAIISTDLIYCPSHGYSDTQKVVFFNGTPATGLTEGNTYFVRDATTDTFKVATTSGGSAIDLTGPSSFGCVVCAITEDEYVLAGTHDLTTTSFSIPD